MKNQKNVNQFFKALFNEGEYVSVVSDVKHTRVFPLADISKQIDAEYFSINPLHNFDLAASEPYHNKDIARRCDANVSAFRSILVELDSVPKEEQVELIKKTGMPYTAITFSGGKSYHFIITLEQDFETRKEYDLLVKRLYKALGGINDPSTKNPSRLSRIPGAIRFENGAIQYLHELSERIPKEKLKLWIESKIGQEVEVVSTQSNHFGSISLLKNLSPFTRNFLSIGASEGFWNATLFKSACDMFRNNYSKEEITSLVFKINNRLDPSDLKTIDSAFKKVSEATSIFL